MGEGSSQVSVPIVLAQPAPPDITTLGHVPGNKFFPCTPEGAEKASRTQYRVDFPFKQGYAARIHSIHFTLPVFLEELSLGSQTSEGLRQTKYKTEGEAQEAVEGKEGQFNLEETVTNPGPEQRYERRVEKGNEWSREGTIAREKVTTTIEWSTLPCPARVIARLVGPEGIIWAETFEVDLAWSLGGHIGAFTGIGAIDQFVDLTNPIAIDPTKTYGLELLISVGSLISTNVKIGPSVAPTGPGGEATFFYDLETTAVGK
jgi:hypothetical protein